MELSLSYIKEMCNIFFPIAPNEEHHFLSMVIVTDSPLKQRCNNTNWQFPHYWQARFSHKTSKLSAAG